jgi:hypothetical protein
MQIPPDIGTILADNCGCHYADMLDVGPPVTDYPESLPLRIETWAQWQSNGTATMMPVIDVALQRLDPTFALTMPPPPPQCNVGGGEPMPAADRQTLIDWLMEGAPDGANWMP